MEDDGVQGNEAVADGIFDEIASANHELYASRGQLDKAATDPAATGKTGGGTPTKPKTQKTDSDEEEGGDNAEGLDTQDFSRELPTETNEAETSTDTEAPKQETNETKPEVDFDWTAGLPSDPGEFAGKMPTPDENGLIDPTQYEDYLLSKIAHQGAVNDYNTKVITATFGAVDKILPEVSSDPGLQAAIRNTYASTLSPEATIEQAKSLRATIDRIAGVNKAAGVQSAKTSITIQKQSAVEARGASQKSQPVTKSDNLSKRLFKGDTSAFEELMGDWLEAGKI